MSLRIFPFFCSRVCRLWFLSGALVYFLVGTAPLIGGLLDIYNMNAGPVRLAMTPAGQICVSDTQLGSVFLYDHAYVLQGEIKGVYEPLGVAVALDGRIYVGSQGHRNIKIYLPDGAIFGSMGNSLVSKPNDMAFDFDGNLYVADSVQNEILVFDSSRHHARTIGGPGSEDGQLSFPSSVAIAYYRDGGGATVGELFVADQGNARVQVFDLQGTFLRKFGSKPTERFGGWNIDGRFTRLQSIQIDDLYRVHAVDSQLTTIQILDAQSGAYIDRYGTFGQDPGELNLPLDITICDPLSGIQKVVAANNGNGLVETVYTLAADGETTLSSVSIPENLPAGTIVGGLSSSAPSGAIFVLLPGFGSEGNDYFVIDGTNLKSTAVFDHAATNGYSIRLKALHDTSLNLAYAETFTIEIANVNEPPTSIAIDDPYVLEDQPLGTEVGQLVTTDGDVADSFTYALVAGTGDGDNASFSISGDRLLASDSLNYETKDTYSIRVRTTDSQAVSFEQVLSVYIWNVIEPDGDPDFDVDGLPDAWEYNHTGSITDLDPNADPDGDGASNEAEFEAGTDPTDSRSIPNVVQGTIIILR